MGNCEDEHRLGMLKSPRRNKYFYGKLMDEFHFQMEQDYSNRKRWLLNRYSLGEGVLHGLNVTLTPDNKKVHLGKGLAIDALGREIIVPENIEIDPHFFTDNCGIQQKEPIPADIKVVYLHLSYRECAADYMPAFISDCTTTEKCIPGTIVECYHVLVLKDKPQESGDEAEKICRILNGSDLIQEPIHRPGDIKPRPLKEVSDTTEDAIRQKGEAINAKSSPSVSTELLRAKINEVLLDQPEVEKPPNLTIPLAAITLNKDGSISINQYSNRIMLQSNEQLFDMILCLAKDGGLRGKQGDKGDPGLGLDPDLPKIIDIAWEHNNAKALDYREFYERHKDLYGKHGLVVTGVEERILRVDEKAPLLTVYFDKRMNKASISRDTFTVEFRVPLIYPVPNSGLSMAGGAVSEPGWAFSGLCVDLNLYGDIVQVNNTSGALTPHTKDAFAYSASFIPKANAFSMVLPMLALYATIGEKVLHLEPARLLIKLKGDFIYSSEIEDREKAVLDADNICGKVGMGLGKGNKKRSRPSGNLTQGGDFESWLKITCSYENNPILPNAVGTKVRGISAKMGAFGLSFSELPVFIHFAGKSQLLAAGCTDDEAERILKERSVRPFIDMQDLSNRAVLGPRTVKKMQSRIIII
jgi:hypothetical protein